MVSRRNYLAITIVMFVVFFMFQFTNVVLESWNGYERNSHVRGRTELLPESSSYKSGKAEEKAPADSGEYIVYIGAEGEKIQEVAAAWSVYTKRDIKSYETAAQYEAAKVKQDTKGPGMMVINSDAVNWEEEELCRQLKSYAEEGIHLVFANLPEAEVIRESKELKELLGIEKIKEEKTEVTGVHLYSGFFLGGEAVYMTEDEEDNERLQDMELTMPWYTLGADTDVYMRGLPEEETEEEERPAVIWRNHFRKAYVFAVNGSYMDDVTGLGILSAITAKMGDYEIYPVVNAQNMVVANYPGLASENDEEIMNRYGQSMEEVFRNIAWPAVVSVYRQNSLGLSCMLAPQYDYKDNNEPDAGALEYNMKRLKEQSAEAGLSAESISDTSLRRKLRLDEDFIEETLPDYKFTSFYTGSLPDEEIEAVLEEDILEFLRTVIRDYDGEPDIIGYQSEYVTRQSALSDGTKHTYREDFRMRSVETALGYSNVLLDMERAAYPETEEDAVEKLVSDFGWNIRNHWKVFKGFEGTTVSECDQRIRSFLSLDYTEEPEDDAVWLKLDAEGMPVWFILRTDREIQSIEGGTWSALEEDVYLIEAGEENLTIEFKYTQGAEREG